MVPFWRFIPIFKFCLKLEKPLTQLNSIFFSFYHIIRCFTYAKKKYIKARLKRVLYIKFPRPDKESSIINSFRKFQLNAKYTRDIHEIFNVEKSDIKETLQLIYIRYKHGCRGFFSESFRPNWCECWKGTHFLRCSLLAAAASDNECIFAENR